MGVAGSGGAWAEGMIRGGMRRNVCHFDDGVYRAARLWWICFPQV